MKLHPGFGIQIDKCSTERVAQNLREHDLVLLRGYDFQQTQFKDFINQLGPLVANFYSFSEGSAMEMDKGEKAADNAKKRAGTKKGKQNVAATKKGKVTKSYTKR